MAPRALGALFALVAALAFATAFVGGLVPTTIPGWWDGHPTVQGKEIERLRTPFAPAEQPIGTLTTNTKGHFSVVPDASALQIGVGFAAEFQGDAGHRMAEASVH